MKLYYMPRTRAFTALWMLEEAGLPYEIVRVPRVEDGQAGPVDRAINPMGKTPALVDGGAGFGETAAILLYIAEKAPASGLAPAPSDPLRGRFLQWLTFPATTMEPAAMERLRKAPENPTAAGWGSYDRMIAALDAALPIGSNLFGQMFTAADLYCASSLKFLMTFGMVEKRDAFVDFVGRAEARPGFQRASAIEAAQTV